MSERKLVAGSLGALSLLEAASMVGTPIDLMPMRIRREDVPSLPSLKTKSLKSRQYEWKPKRSVRANKKHRIKGARP